MKHLNYYCLVIVVMLAFLACKPVADAKLLSEAPPKQATPAEPVSESDEQKAVRLAEEFIRRNGYTGAPADRKKLSHETVEFSQSIEELLKLRENTLEEKAFGVSPHGRSGEKGWTVVFRYAKRIRDELKTKNRLVSDPDLAGRAVTMNPSFEHLLVEHKDFFLDKVDKKL